jgi:hypothetical protein
LNFYASPGFVAETMSIYLARGLHPGTASRSNSSRLAPPSAW